MADNQKQFEEFLGNIELVGDDLTSLRKSRDANRERITKYWKEKLERIVPDFEEQGSFEMGTVVRPIEGDYDLDDGMYLNCMGNDPDHWEPTATIQGWIVDAVTAFTKGDPEKRNRCVRVPYKDGYHIDIPAYGIDSFGATRVYEKAKRPVEFDESNPVALVDWFKERTDSHDDLRDLVRYFKAWRDYKKGSLQKVKSVTLTVLISERIVSSATYGRAMVDTARSCEAFLRGGGSVYKPVAPFEDLTEGWSDDNRTAIAECFKSLADRGEDALAAESVRDGALIWQKQFGPRFPVPDEGQEKFFAGAIVTKEPPIVTSGTFA